MSWLINAQRQQLASRPKTGTDHRQRLAAMRQNNPAAQMGMPDAPGSETATSSSPCAAAAHSIAATVSVEPRQIRKKRKAEAFSSQVALSNTILGTGAFGVVYLGIHQNSGAWVAVKQMQIRPQPGTANRTAAIKNQLDEMAEEIRLMKNLDHPNVVHYLHAETINNEQLNIYMEYMSGGSLASLIKRFDKLPEAMIRTYMAQAIAGIAFLHQKNIVHRDIKADNILLHSDGVAKLSDFGTSREVSDSANLLTVTGTPWFMAPEVVKGTGHGAPADIWSLGCTMIQLASGVAPFSEFTNPVTAMYNVALHPGKVLGYIPETCGGELKSCLHWCLQENPASRPSAADLLMHPFFQSIAADDGSDGSESTGSPASAAIDPALPIPVAGYTNVIPLQRISQVAPSRPTTPISSRTARLRDETQNQQGMSVVALQ
ncbi:protein kinase, putative [Bodo saltans]|uniref:Protein kinase, putative n=1 Tax=Bodo saltans TaxID=75058 RepID=A0A0S4J3Y5_BODSA|nr:protein kinase, putative [Bodo saltans]|eukprot:CUG86150.1 protein kinase, putative [Bodo saltans]